MKEISETASFPVEEARLYEMCDRLISDYRAKIAPDDKNGQTDYIFNRLSKSIRSKLLELILVTEQLKS